MVHAHRAIPPEGKASDTPRYAGKTVTEKAQLLRAESQLISRFMRCNLDAVAWRCHACGGRIDIRRKTTNTPRAKVDSTTGKCRTPGCLDWED